MKLIVGLGNPGKEYANTRHNIGFAIIDKLNNNEQLTINKKNQAEISKTDILGKRVMLAKPTTYMNNSGLAVKSLLNFYKLESKNLLVIHDDKDIPLGEFRVQTDRGSAGHNGVQSIIDQLETKDFARIRVGVAPLDKKVYDTADFVLNKLTKKEWQTLNTVFERVLNEIKKLLI